MPFSLKHADQAVTFSMQPTDLRLDPESATLHCQSGGDAAEIVLTPELLKQLGLQCIALMPELEPRMAVPSFEEACRIPAYALKLLDAREIQCLIRECQCNVLETFLWYMKDADLLRLILRNMSQRAAEMLLSDLEHRWFGRNPDKATESKARQGREAVAEIMQLARRMCDEGRIAELQEYGPPPARPSAEAAELLTPNEVDELIKGISDD